MTTSKFTPARIAELRALVARDVASMTEAERLVFSVIPELLDEVESLQLSGPLDPNCSHGFRGLHGTVCVHCHGSHDVQQLNRDLEQANERLVERGAWHDTVLAKDFLALYQAARMVTSALQTSAPSIDVEGLALHVTRLAPLYDDVRRQLSVQSAAREPVSLFDEAAAYVNRTDKPRGQHEALPLVEIVCQIVDIAVETGQVTGATVTQQGEVVQALLTRAAGGGIPLDPAHTRRVLQTPGSIRFECDHKFLGGPTCVRCRKPFAELQAESAAEAAELRAEAARDDALGSTLRELAPRIDALVKTGRFAPAHVGVGPVISTLLVLGLLEAEGMDPRAYVGEPKQHISPRETFVSFALPHEGAEVRRDVLRQLIEFLHEWFDEGDPLRPSIGAALERLPR